MTKEQLLDAYKEAFGEPDSISYKNEGTLKEFLMLYAFPIEEEELLEASITTIGLSPLLLDMGCEGVELTIFILGDDTMEQQYKEIGEALAFWADNHLKEKKCLVINTVLYNISIPYFENMSCLYLRSNNYNSPEWLGEFTPPVKIVELVPLYSVEAGILDDLPERMRANIFNEIRAAWSDPSRKPVSPVEQAVEKVWNNISEWFNKHAIVLYGQLKEGANEEDLLQLEKAINVLLPLDYRAALKVHNGEVYFHSYRFLSTSDVVSTWNAMKKLAWNEKWIPFAKDEQGNMIYLDLSIPAKPGIGQWEKSIGATAGNFTSFFEWLLSYQKALYAGYYQVNKEGFLELKHNT